MRLLVYLLLSRSPMKDNECVLTVSDSPTVKCFKIVTFVKSSFLSSPDVPVSHIYILVVPHGYSKTPYRLHPMVYNTSDDIHNSQEVDCHVSLCCYLNCNTRH